MLKHRICATILIRDGQMVKGEGFASDRVVGSPRQAASVYEARQIDELFILDVGAWRYGRPDVAMVEKLTDGLNMPVTVGGGVRALEHIRQLMVFGADKVVLGAALLKRDFLCKAAHKYGSQALVASIDVRDGLAMKSHGGMGYRAMGDVAEWAEQIEKDGAGEILLQDINRDGTMWGYGLDSIQDVCAATSIPVVASGGCRDADDMYFAYVAGAAAFTAGALWQFTDATPKDVRDTLCERGVPVR